MMHEALTHSKGHVVGRLHHKRSKWLLLGRRRRDVDYVPLLVPVANSINVVHRRKCCILALMLYIDVRAECINVKLGLVKKSILESA